MKIQILDKTKKKKLISGLEEFGINKIQELLIRTGKERIRAYSGNLSKEEIKIVQILENESLQFDEIVRKLKIDSAKLGTILSIMEVKGLLKNSSGSYSLSN